MGSKVDLDDKKALYEALDEDRPEVFRLDPLD